MKNSLNLVFIALLLVVLGCSCPQLKQLGLDRESLPAKTPPEFNIKPANVADAETKSTAGSELTLAKFNRVQTGMSYKEVVAILGSEGEVLSSTEAGSFKTESYKWQGENFATVIAVFQNDKLFTKTQANLK